MPTPVSQAKHNVLTWLLRNNYQTLNSKLQRLLPPELARVFTILQQNDTTSIWSSAVTGNYISLNQATEDQKDEAADVLRDAKAQIVAYLEKDSELREIKDTLFRVPTDDNILIYPQGDNGEMIVVLTQWGCNTIKNNHTNNPVGLITQRPSKNTVDVHINLKYTNDRIASDTKFVYQYKSIQQIKTTDNKGYDHLGSFKFGALITIAEEGKLEHGTVLKIVEGQELYEVTLPFITEATINVQNQKGEPISGYELSCKIRNHATENSYRTNDSGQVLIDGITLYNQTIEIKDPRVPSNFQSHTLQETDNVYSFEIKERIAKDVWVEVVDAKDQLLANYTLDIESEEKGTTSSYISDANGIIIVKDIAVATDLIITDPRTQEHLTTYKVIDSDEQQRVRVSIVPKFVTFQLLDRKSNAIPSIPIDVKQNEFSGNGTTDNDGKIQIARENFIDGEKIKTTIHYQNPKKKKKKVKKIKRTLTYTREQDTYILKLKRDLRWLWLLLLLLLPLLLLITEEKNIYVKTVFENTDQVLPNSPVFFKYNSDYLYSQDEFFYTNSINENSVSNNKGIASFEKIEYSWYSWLFKRSSKASFYSRTDCHMSDTLAVKFHSIKNNDTLILRMRPNLGPIDFKVVDREDNEALPDADVSLNAEINGKNYIRKGKTGVDGRVVFDSLPICGQINEIKAELYGYESDSIVKKPITDVLGNINRRTLRLKPLKEPIEFFVTDCNTGEPLPGAKAVITLTNKKKKVSSKTVTTNVDGVGKGSYDNAHIIARLGIDVTKPYFKPGKLKGNYTVEQFIKLPKKDRTICLIPEDRCVTFKNIDSLTRKPLAAAKSIVSITYNKKTKIDTVYSSSDGTFKVCGIKFGSKVSIVSSYDPYYIPNDYKIKDTDAQKLLEPKSPEDLVIPLKPKTKTLKFRTIDPLRALVDNVTLEVYIDGRLVRTPSNSGAGIFTVNAYANSKITIKATKTGYVPNTTKIVNELVEPLANAPQDDRDIPMLFPPCQNGEQFTGGEKVKRFDLGKTNGTFSLEYFTDSQADSIYIYSGNSNSRIWKYEGATNTKSFGDPRFTESIFSSARYITVKIRGSSNWGYRFNCPK